MTEQGMVPLWPAQGACLCMSAVQQHSLSCGVAGLCQFTGVLPGRSFQAGLYLNERGCMC